MQLRQEQHVTEHAGKTIRPFGMRDKLGYLFGAFVNGFSFQFVSAYLMVVYTDIFGINAATVGILFLVAT